MKTIKDFEEDFNFNIRPHLLSRLQGLDSPVIKDVDKVNKFLVSSMTELLESLRIKEMKDPNSVDYSDGYVRLGYNRAVRKFNLRIDSML